MNDKITIVVASDNHYAILIAALLKSIEINHKTPEHIDFYIIDDGISHESIRKINSIPDPSKITLNWRKREDIVPKEIVIPADTSAFPITAYMRLFAPYVVDETLDKYIYLDVDTIVQDDISLLWNTDLGDYTIAAAQDVGKTFDCAWGGVPNYAELGYSADTHYFNSGVQVVNPKKWRELNITKKAIDVLVKHQQHVKLADQYAFNVIFANKWLRLDPLWNWFAFQEDVKPKLIHFLDIKPIFKSYHSQPVYKDIFFQYLDMTPWRGFKPRGNHRRLLQKVINKVKKRIARVTQLAA
ncbi:MAG: glycosyltransferase family 8 protein [Sediminibacterium sp.]|jgi:lipopolysaccharide biosynthesis glycosyltransferase|nr:glycosyltransferase family 8 protein [Chitinophagaceae bacterium]MCA6445801.1 glycosyltransferase family 8 protein [Chitinophagaceae bacterium]